jgi:hypothetical protein
VLDVYMRTNMMYRTFTIVVVYGCLTRIVPTIFFHDISVHADAVTAMMWP